VYTDKMSLVFRGTEEKYLTPVMSACGILDSKNHQNILIL